MHIQPFRRLALAFAALFVTLVAAAPALAAPDWAPAQTYPQPAGRLTTTQVGFAQGGTATAARVDLISQTPVATALHVAARAPGGTFVDQLTIRSSSGAFPVRSDLAVAANGAAVVVWTELTALVADAPLRFRASYRPAGSTTWEAPTTILTDVVGETVAQDAIKAAIAPDGTAAVAVTHVEPNATGEFQEDANLDIAIRPAAGVFGAATRVSPANQSVSGAALAFDASDNLTLAFNQRVSEGPAANLSDDRLTVITRRRSHRPA